jgi:hypothetical protein
MARNAPRARLRAGVEDQRALTVRATVARRVCRVLFVAEMLSITLRIVASA